MVCLTTFCDTKRVISHSLIIFYKFYGCAHRGVSSPPEGHPSNHLIFRPHSHSLYIHTWLILFFFSFLLYQFVFKSLIGPDSELSNTSLQIQPPPHGNIGKDSPSLIAEQQACGRRQKLFLPIWKSPINEKAPFEWKLRHNHLWQTD